MAAAIVVGTVIGSGVFKKARNVAENVPETGLALSVWVLGGVLALLGALAYAEVATLFPRAGGNYVFLREGYGRMAGFLWGWVEFWIIRTGSIAALATMFTESFHDVLRQALYPGQTLDVLPFWPRQLLTVLVIAALAALNARGTRLGGGLQVVVTSVKVGSLLFIIALPFAVLAAVGEPSVVINIGTGAGVTVRELVVAFEKVFGQPVPLREAPSRPGDVPGAFANVDRAHSLLGWHHELSLEEAIASALAWGERRQEILGYE
jgi:amino acid transporter